LTSPPGPVVRHAACLHATSEQEYEEIRAFGLSNPVAIIPNGIDVPAPSGPIISNGGKRTVLSLRRIHPKKGLDRLVRHGHGAPGAGCLCLTG
jgi:glycosyltransferase involved in cell wall biosynthesis